jgi:hypothetical protein
MQRSKKAEGAGLALVLALAAIGLTMTLGVALPVAKPILIPFAQANLPSSFSTSSVSFVNVTIILATKWNVPPGPPQPSDNIVCTASFTFTLTLGSALFRFKDSVFTSRVWTVDSVVGNSVASFTQELSTSAVSPFSEQVAFQAESASAGTLTITAQSFVFFCQSLESP